MKRLECVRDAYTLRLDTTCHFLTIFHLPVLSRMMALSLGLKRASVLLRMNSTTTDWIRTSMNAAVPLKQADSICLDLKHR